MKQTTKQIKPKRENRDGVLANNCGLGVQERNGAELTGAEDLELIPGQPRKLTLTVREAAAQLGISEKSVRRLLQRGKIRCISALRHKLIPILELERFLREELS